MNDSESETRVPIITNSRRKFLCGVAAAGAGLAWMDAESAHKTDYRSSQMESPIELVRRFCAAWSNDAPTAELAAFFTDAAVYHNMMMDPINGKEAIAKNFASFIRPGAPGIESLKLHILNIAASGPIVLTERVDYFKTPKKSWELPIMGIFETSEGKISAWRDYFDLGQFTSRMG